MAQEGYKVVMPKLGLIMTEAQLVEWCKGDGDWVEKGEVLFTLESEKSTLEIEAPTSGFVKIVVQAGEIVPVHSTVAFIYKSKNIEHTADITEENVEVKLEKVIKKASSEENVQTLSGIRATPYARNLAKENNISLENVTGTGIRGMIVGRDLKTLVRDQRIKATPLARKIAKENNVDLHILSGTGPRGMITRTDVENNIHKGQNVRSSLEKADVNEDVQQLSGLRSIIAERLVAGWQERPQVTLVAEVDVSNLVSMREQIVAESGKKISYNAFILKAVSQALVEFPFVNAQLSGNQLVQKKDINIGIAVDTSRGLMVPVVRNVDDKSVFEIEFEIKALAEKAMSGESLPDELVGGTFTVTNLGVFGIDAFTPIINPPEAAILGVGQIAPKPAVVGGQLVIRDLLTLSLAFDHRLMDGAPAAKFVQRIKQLLNRPVVLLSKLK